MADLGSLVVKLSAETSEFREDLGRTARLLDRHANDMKASMQQVASVAKTTFAVVIGATSVAALRDFVTHTLEAAAALQGLSEQTGASAVALSGFAPVATISGTAMEAIGVSLAKLSKGLAGLDDGFDASGQRAMVAMVGPLGAGVGQCRCIVWHSPVGAAFAMVDARLQLSYGGGDVDLASRASTRR